MDSSLMNNRRLSTKDFVYHEIKRQVITGELKPSQPINEIKTASELGISRTPLREALQRLEIEELIIRQTNGRLRVAPISIQEAKEIYNVRGLLEGLIVKEAAAKVKEDDIQKLQVYTELLNDAAVNNRTEDVVKYGSEIHSMLYQISGNQTAIKILTNMNNKISRYRRLGPNDRITRSKEAAFEHKRLTEAIAERNPIKAENIMREHINNSLTAALESIKGHIDEYE